MANLPGEQIPTGLPTQIDPANPGPAVQAVQDWLDKMNAQAKDRAYIAGIQKFFADHPEAGGWIRANVDAALAKPTS